MSKPYTYNNYRSMQSTAAAERENEIVDFLYEDGPHSIDQIAAHFGCGRDWASKAMTALLHQGRVEKCRLRKGETTIYWLYKE